MLKGDDDDGDNGDGDDDDDSDDDDGDDNDDDDGNDDDVDDDDAVQPTTGSLSFAVASDETLLTRASVLPPSRLPLLTDAFATILTGI